MQNLQYSTAAVDILLLEFAARQNVRGAEKVNERATRVSGRAAPPASRVAKVCFAAQLVYSTYSTVQCSTVLCVAAAGVHSSAPAEYCSVLDGLESTRRAERS